MRTFLAAFLAAACLGAGSARADILLDYGRVICTEDDEIVLQFVRTEEGSAPIFEPLPDGRNFDVPAERAATCGSNEGRVRLMQGYLDDATAYGANMGWSTPVFTLIIGDRIAFRRFTIRERGYPAPPNLRSVVIRGETATLCRDEGACTYQPIEFTSVDALRRIDTLDVRPVRERDRALCQSFVISAPRYWSIGVAQGSWPTYLHDPRDEIAGDNWTGVWNEPPEQFDLNNDGRLDRPVHAQGFGGRGSNYGFWALPPRDLSDAEYTAITERLTWGHELETLVPELLREGWIVHTGEETRFAEIHWVYIEAVMRGDATYLLASRRGDALSVLLQQTPNGSLRELCVYERAPDL